MNRCPKCHSTMLLDFTDTMEGFQRMWKCIGCGREVLKDANRQAEDERLLQRVREGATVR